MAKKQATEHSIPIVGKGRATESIQLTTNPMLDKMTDDAQVHSPIAHVQPPPAEAPKKKVATGDDQAEALLPEERELWKKAKTVVTAFRMHESMSIPHIQLSSTYVDTSAATGSKTRDFQVRSLEIDGMQTFLVLAPQIAQKIGKLLKVPATNVPFWF